MMPTPFFLFPCYNKSEIFIVNGRWNNEKNIDFCFNADPFCRGFGSEAFAAGSLAHFTERESYGSGTFSDVDESEWYGAENQAVIQTAYRLGIMNGMGDGAFLPKGNIRISEAVKMAAVVHDIYHGGSGQFDMSGTPWYKSCVDYAVQNGIIADGNFSDYTAYATRAELAFIFANALPESEFPAVNTVNSVAKVQTSTLAGIEHSEEILLLYRAGVLAGDEESRHYRPADPITRRKRRHHCPRGASRGTSSF
jgi:hypothetical protein